MEARNSCAALLLSLSLGLGSLNLEKNLPKISLASGAVLGLLRRRACACDMRHAAGALANRRLDDEIARGFVEGTFPQRN